MKYLLKTEEMAIGCSHDKWFRSWEWKTKSWKKISFCI